MSQKDIGCGGKGFSGLLVSGKAAPILVAFRAGARPAVAPLVSKNVNVSKYGKAGACIVADLDGDTMPDAIQPFARGSLFFKGLAPGKFAPMLIRMPGRWEYHFIWANECLWIAKETFSGPEREGQRACGRLANLVVNGEPVDGIPVLSDEQVRAAEAELAAAEEQARKDRERE